MVLVKKMQKHKHLK